MKNHTYFLRLSLFLSAAVAALVLAACGGDDEEGAVSGPDPASFTPADAPIYGESVLKPEGDTKENIEGALDKVTNGMDVGALINQELESSLSEDGVSWSEDVEPILGSTMGGFVTSFDGESPEGAFGIAVTDTGAAEDLILNEGGEEFTDEDYNGTTIHNDSAGEASFAIIGDFLVIGTPQAVKDSVDADAGDSLADSGAADALDDVPDDTVFAFYADVKAALDAVVSSGVVTQQMLEQSGVSDQLEELGDEPVVFSGGVTTDSFSFEATGPAGEGAVEPTDIVSSLPSEAWVAFGAPDVGQQIENSFQQFLDSFKAGFQAGLGELSGEVGGSPIEPADISDLDVQIEKTTGLDISRDFGWIGDVGGFVQGTSLLEVGGGIVITTDDASQATATLTKLRNALGRERSLRITPGDDGGFNVQPVDAPVGAEVAVRDDKVVFAFAGASVDEVLEPSETLGDSDRFSSAAGVLGDDLTPSFFFDLTTILSLVESSGAATGDPDYEAAKAYLSALDYMIAGSSLDDGSSTGRFVLGLKEPSEDSSTSSAAITP